MTISEEGDVEFYDIEETGLTVPTGSLNKCEKSSGSNSSLSVSTSSKINSEKYSLAALHKQANSATLLCEETTSSAHPSNDELLENKYRTLKDPFPIEAKGVSKMFESDNGSVKSSHQRETNDKYDVNNEIGHNSSHSVASGENSTHALLQKGSDSSGSPFFQKTMNLLRITNLDTNEFKYVEAEKIGEGDLFKIFNAKSIEHLQTDEVEVLRNSIPKSKEKLLSKSPEGALVLTSISEHSEELHSTGVGLDYLASKKLGNSIRHPNARWSKVFQAKKREKSSENVPGNENRFKDDLENRPSSPSISNDSSLSKKKLIRFKANKKIPCRIRSRCPFRKKEKYLTNLWLIGEIKILPETAIWSISISSDGLWIALGCQDGSLRIWKVERQMRDSGIFDTTVPKIVFVGHKAAISVCGFDWEPLNGVQRLASASLDKTCRIWNLPNTGKDAGSTRCTVMYTADWSTGISFHPKEKSKVFTASLDGSIQAWRIPDILDSNEPRELAHKLYFLKMTELVTAMSISPNGNILAVGLELGGVALYLTADFTFLAEIDCRNRKGYNSCGRKVTGITWESSSMRICVSTSDSRIRLIMLDDVSNWLKFKGHCVTKTMLHASFSPDEQHLICGSENSWIHVWNSQPDSDSSTTVALPVNLRYRKKITNAYSEVFKAFNSSLTACHVGSKKFCANLAYSIKNSTSTSWKELQSFLCNADMNRFDPVCTLTIVTATAEGVARVFINLGNSIS